MNDIIDSLNIVIGFLTDMRDELASKPTAIIDVAEPKKESNAEQMQLADSAPAMPRTHKAWSIKEERTMLQLHKQGMSYHLIGKSLGRTTKSIEKRMFDIRHRL